MISKLNYPPKKNKRDDILSRVTATATTKCMEFLKLV